jgi:NodT family efflux transporter outer membrane factor (OMF) lipoprotein
LSKKTTNCRVVAQKEQKHLVPLVLLVFLLSFSSCTVGPKYKVPTTPTTATFKESKDWKQAEPQDTALRGDWWELYADPELNALESQVNISNQNIAAAEARFQSARAAIKVANAALYPTVTIGETSTGSQAGAGRGTVSGNTLVATSGNRVAVFHQIPIDVSYEADVWGRIRRTIESNRENAQATAADLETIRLSSHSDLANNYFQIRGLDEDLKLLQQSISDYQQALDLTMNRYNQGIASAVDVAQAQTQLDTTRAQATNLGVARSAFEHAIAVLIGKPPADLTIGPAELPMQPPAIPLALPSELLERRPDVAAAERRAAAANALIGVAKAAYYPRLTFNLTAGVQSSTLGSLFSWPSRFWSLGPALNQIIFDAGARHGLTQEAEANYDTAVATYRQTVLMAFQDVEDNLAALRILEQEAGEQDVAIASAARSRDLAMNRYRGGITTYLEVLTAQNVLLTNQQTAVGIRARRMSASVLLIKALGGGWNVGSLPPLK